MLASGRTVQGAARACLSSQARLGGMDCGFQRACACVTDCGCESRRRGRAVRAAVDSARACARDGVPAVGSRGRRRGKGYNAHTVRIYRCAHGRTATDTKRENLRGTEPARAAVPVQAIAAGRAVQVSRRDEHRRQDTGRQGPCAAGDARGLAAVAGGYPDGAGARRRVMDYRQEVAVGQRSRNKASAASSIRFSGLARQ
jgi:hypothetical protein